MTEQERAEIIKQARLDHQNKNNVTYESSEDFKQSLTDIIKEIQPALDYLKDK